MQSLIFLHDVFCVYAIKRVDDGNCCSNFYTASQKTSPTFLTAT